MVSVISSISTILGLLKFTTKAGKRESLFGQEAEAEQKDGPR
jgi:hypothetical protein